MDELVRLLIEKNISLSCIDFLGIDFASHLGVDNNTIYKGTLATRHSDVIVELLGINEDVLDYYGYDSQELTGLMAINGQKKFKSDICLAYSGDDKMAHIYLAVAYKEMVSTFCFQLSGKRNQNIEQAILLGIEKTLRMINEI